MTDNIMQLALIREDECVGCMKCIEACPVDAILGSENLMHTVIAEECIGCKLCLPPCPVDCIDLVPAPTGFNLKSKEHIIARSKSRKDRLTREDDILMAEQETNSLDKRKSYLIDALKRRNQLNTKE